MEEFFNDTIEPRAAVNIAHSRVRGTEIAIISGIRRMGLCEADHRAGVMFATRDCVRRSPRLSLARSGPVHLSHSAGACLVGTRRSLRRCFGPGRKRRVGGSAKDPSPYSNRARAHACPRLRLRQRSPYLPALEEDPPGSPSRV
ncbi:hypothetical protein ANANG_G00162460 [Anguilla anguilla]|uniref:Uncharacterized protein n=1 Tax=Anguilla anguilla TaxID=7936 RepID=A0A9D3MAE5_ANGAN|nr:hypothetical protein ANANG_G00162460 [Anguilla anguilla]